MAMNDLYEKPVYLIRRAHQIALSMFREECGAHDLTPVQYASLIAIRENPGIDATRISSLIAFDRSTLGKVLERIEAKGLVRRAGSVHDTRVKRVVLTAEGAQLLAAAEPAVCKGQDRLLASLTPAERDQFISTLSHLLQLNNEYSRAPLRDL